MDKNKMANKSIWAWSWPLKLSLLVVVVLAILLIIISFAVRPLLALGEILVLGVTVGIFYFAFTKLEKQTAKYLDDLSFREDRGEQEALINIPIGLLLYSNNAEHTV
ncbi:MAG: hypothetical protein M3Z90_02685, partial [Bombilactobacillus mellis]|nr:hypothetical protein [Bombilactobacillus mellis]MCT6872739.1 hypothetical protein [Bombilactobacillus mellis]